MYAYLWVVQKTAQADLPVIPQTLPANVILFGFHQDYYSVLAARNIHLPGGEDLVWLGYHRFFSYIPFLWFRRNKTRLFRYRFGLAKKPLDQIISFLEANPNTRLAMGTDSGRPYGRVRESLVKLAATSRRPVVGMRIRPSRSVSLFGHDLPLPGSSFQMQLSKIVKAEELIRLGVVQGHRLLQDAIDAV